MTRSRVAAWSALICLATLLVQSRPLADQATPDASAIFDEVVLTTRVESPVSLDGLGPEDIAALTSAHRTLTEFFTRLVRPGSSSPLDLLTDELRARYETPVQLFRENYNAELLISFRVHDYELDRQEGRIVFRFFLWDTMEGVDTITQRSATLIRIPDGRWRVVRL